MPRHHTEGAALQGPQARVYGKGTAVDGSPPLKRRHADSAAPSPIEPAQGAEPQPAAAPEPKLPTSAFVGVTWAKKRKEVQGGKIYLNPSLLLLFCLSLFYRRYRIV